jgi:hypothetical protein
MAQTRVLCNKLGFWGGLLLGGIDALFCSSKSVPKYTWAKRALSQCLRYAVQRLGFHLVRDAAREMLLKFSHFPPQHK